jgi:rhodanese-related sulfurtransferase
MKNISRRSLLIIGATMLIGAGASAEVRPAGNETDPAQTLTPPQAHAKAAAGEILLIDIRRPDEWRKTGVGQHATPIDMRDKDFIKQLQQARGSSTQPIALMCARGVRSARMTAILVNAGIGPIIDVPEGMLGSRAGPGWLDRNLPVTSFD